jgi:hypothetical protein
MIWKQPKLSEYYSMHLIWVTTNNLKISFVIAHWIGDQILWIVKCNLIALCLYSLATIPNTEKAIDISIRPNCLSFY